MKMTTEWIRVAPNDRPDEDIVYLLAFADGSVCAGYRDGNAYYNIAAGQCLAAPLWWADMPQAPLSWQS
jgi:hypothetical protein